MIHGTDNMIHGTDNMIHGTDNMIHGTDNMVHIRTTNFAHNSQILIAPPSPDVKSGFGGQA